MMCCEVDGCINDVVLYMSFWSPGAAVNDSVVSYPGELHILRPTHKKHVFKSVKNWQCGGGSHELSWRKLFAFYLGVEFEICNWSSHEPQYLKLRRNIWGLLMKMLYQKPQRRLLTYTCSDHAQRRVYIHVGPYSISRNLDKNFEMNIVH